MACAAACGGGGGGGGSPAFALAGSFPGNGSTAAPTHSAVFLTFTAGPDPATVTTETVTILRESDGAGVPFDVVVEAHNTANVRLDPHVAFAPNERYRVELSAAIRSAGGASLGDVAICFVTASPGPTVRPDQIVDLGDRLNVPRYGARAVRLRDGRVVVVGGFVDGTTATGSIELWDPSTRTFVLLDARLGTPRAEFTATLLGDGRVLVAGGVAAPGGRPLESTEFYDPASDGVGPGPEMNTPRRWHAASPVGTSGALVTGGFTTAADDSAVDHGELLTSTIWIPVPGRLAGPAAQHLQATYDLDRVYIGTGNFFGEAGLFDGVQIQPRLEGDGRLRGTVARVDDDRLLVVGGDTRSILVYDFGSNATWGARELLRDRRGAHSLTVRDGDPALFLAAGGFRISEPGSPPLASLEVVRYLPTGPFGLPDAAVSTVENVTLPVPMAGHVGFNDSTGATVLAGGWGGDSGPHLRRVVLVLDALSTPPLGCR